MVSWRALGLILESPGLDFGASRPPFWSLQPRVWSLQARLWTLQAVCLPLVMLPTLSNTTWQMWDRSLAWGSFLFCSCLPQRPGQTKAFLEKQSLPALIIPPLISICQCIHLCIQLMHIKPQRPCQSLGGGGVPPWGLSIECLQKRGPKKHRFFRSFLL